MKMPIKKLAVAVVSIGISLLAAIGILCKFFKSK